MSMGGSFRGEIGTMDIGYEVSFESGFQVYSSEGPGFSKRSRLMLV